MVDRIVTYMRASFPFFSASTTLSVLLNPPGSALYSLNCLLISDTFSAPFQRCTTVTLEIDCMFLCM